MQSHSVNSTKNRVIFITENWNLKVVAACKRRYVYIQGENQ